MTALIKKYFDDEYLKSMALQKKYDDEAYELFIVDLHDILQDEEKYSIVGEEINKEDVLNYALNYVDEVEKVRNKGYSFQWAKEFAYIKIREENQNPTAMAYHKTYKIDSQKALTDLQLYASHNIRDEFFLKHFMCLSEKEAPNASPSIEEQAIVYSKIFKEQLQNGKSELFADRYADLKAMDMYTDIGCYAEASEYEKAISAGYSAEYANAFAMHLSDFIANNFVDYEAAVHDELVLLKAKELEEKFERLK